MSGSVTALIVSWNVLPLLRSCLRALQPELAPGDELLVVDNNSDDGTAEAIRREFPSVRLLQTGANLGFSGGVNAGLKRGAGDYALVLNPDTEARPGAVAAMRRLLDADAVVGVVAPRLVYPDGRPQPSRRRFPRLDTLFVESTPLQALPAAAPILRRFYCADSSDKHVQQVDWAVGACLMLRMAALEEVGAFDGSFFMYSEEVDLCLRAAKLGWQVVYEPAAMVVHHEAKSSDQVPASRLLHFHQSRVSYAAKHFGLGAAMCLRAYLLSGLMWQMGLEAVKLLLGHKRELRRGRIRAYRTVLRRGLAVHI